VQEHHLGFRYPRAWQLLRMRLFDATFPRVPAVAAWLQGDEATLRVRVVLPERGLAWDERFTPDELRMAGERWAEWVEQITRAVVPTEAAPPAMPDDSVP
jgi:hypothetical protein